MQFWEVDELYMNYTAITQVQMGSPQRTAGVRSCSEAAASEDRDLTGFNFQSFLLNSISFGGEARTSSFFSTFSSQVKREAEHFKSSVESGKRKRSRGSKSKEAAAASSVEENAAVQKPFVFRQKETEAQIRKRKIADDVKASTTTTCGVEPEVKKKKLKKKKESEKSTTEKTKSKKGKKLQQEAKSSKGRSKEGGERSALLKSVFGGGGAS